MLLTKRISYNVSMVSVLHFKDNDAPLRLTSFARGSPNLQADKFVIINKKRTSQLQKIW